MLVKFLSFMATVFGTKRYKTIFLSCLALFFSLVGLTGFALTRTDAPLQGAGASAAVKDDPKADAATDNSKLGIRQQQAVEEQAQQTEEQANTATPTPQPPADQTATDQPVNTPYDFTLSTTDQSLPKGGTITVTATPADTSKIAWTAAALDNDSGNALHVTNQDTSNGFSFTLKVDKDAQPGKYKVIVTAKDGPRNINLTKTVTVTVVNQ